MRRKIFFTLVFGPALAMSSFASDVYLSLSAHGQRVDVGAAGFAPATPTMDESRIGRQVHDIIRRDMLYARYFNILDDGPLYTGKDEELKVWADRGAEIIITGKVKLLNEELTVQADLVDVVSKQSIWSKKISGKISEVRKISHELNDEIISRFTGEKGIASKKIVFVNNKTGYKEIYTCDYDGYNLRQLTFDRSINILPAWAPDGSNIYYTTYKYQNPDLYMMDKNGGSKRAFSARQGLNCTPTISPDGSSVVMTLSRGKIPNLFLLNGAGKIVRQLTSGDDIVTSPCFSPNGREIVYISDVPGYPQLFIMGIEGGNVRRLPARGYCDSPQWSSRGDKIVFTMRELRGGQNYDLYVYDLATANVSRLTQDAGQNQNPSWSADGRFIVFVSNRSGKDELYIIAADGSGMRSVGDFSGSCYSPRWEP